MAKDLTDIEPNSEEFMALGIKDQLRVLEFARLAKSPLAVKAESPRAAAFSTQAREAGKRMSLVNVSPRQKGGEEAAAKGRDEMEAIRDDLRNDSAFLFEL
jgi:hypothetical protein